MRQVIVFAVVASAVFIGGVVLLLLALTQARDTPQAYLIPAVLLISPPISVVMLLWRVRKQRRDSAESERK